MNSKKPLLKRRNSNLLSTLPLSFILCSLPLYLTGCGGSSDTVTDDNTPGNNITDQGPVEPVNSGNQQIEARQQVTQLETTPASSKAFADYMKTAFNNLNQQQRTSDVFTNDAIAFEEVALASSAPAAESVSADTSSTAAAGSESQTSDGDSLYSTTYLQEQGVDESDLVKFDGQFLYVAKQPQFYGWAEPLPLLIDEPAIDESAIERAEAGTTTEIQPAAVSARLSLAPPYGKHSNATIRVMQVEDEPASASEVTTIEIEQPLLDLDKTYGNGVNIDGLYLYQDQLTVLTAQSHFWHWDYYANWTGGAIGIESFDTSNPTQAITTKEKAIIEGAYLIGSRRIGNSLYLVTRTTPYLKGYHWYPTSDEQIADNQAIIDNMDVASLMPTIRFTGEGDNAESTIEPLVEPNTCFLPYENKETASNDSSPSNNSSDNDSSSDDIASSISRISHYRPEIISIVQINLNDLTDRKATCTTAPTQGIYMSQQALYLFGHQPFYFFNDEPQTGIHKFSLSESGPEYRGSNGVPGYLGWNNPAYRLGERDGALIAVTSRAAKNDAIPGDTGHRLTVLQESASNAEGSESSALGFNTVAQIPNADQPTVIGKPNESIFGVRIMGDRAYIVTFLRTDPLYVIDLSTPTAPYIAGSLELPGFSEFLHPINANLLLGVGHDADLEGVVNGLKVSLFNVSDISNPLELESLTLGDRGSHTPVTYNPKAFSLLQTSNDQLRLTLPVKIHEKSINDNPSIWQHDWKYTGLELLEVAGVSDNTLTTTALNRVGAIKRASSDRVEAGSEKEEDVNNTTTYPAWLNAVERGILLNESVHYLSGDQLWSAPWSAPEDAVGPQ